MDPFAKPKTSRKITQNSGNNPFAKAMAETERSFSDPKPKEGNNPFSEALARTGGRLPDDMADRNGSNNQDATASKQSQADLEKQRLEMEKQQKKEAMRKKLHDQVNPVDMKDVFDAREKKVKEELEMTRQELKKLAVELAGLRMDLDIEASKVVTNPGQSGTYYVNFFQQFRSFIILLTQKVRSARTWARQMNAKNNKKKRRKGSSGMEISGKGHEQTKTVFDTMHHERSNAYGGS